MEKRYILKVSADGRVEREPFDSAGGLGQLQRSVGGYIERVPIPMVRGHDLFVNEDGIAERLPYNMVASRFVIGQSRGATLGILGNATFAAHDRDGETIGLTDAECADIERALARFGGRVAKAEGGAE